MSMSMSVSVSISTFVHDCMYMRVCVCARFVGPDEAETCELKHSVAKVAASHGAALREAVGEEYALLVCTVSCSVLWGVCSVFAVCCSVLQCVAVCCSELQ